MISVFLFTKILETLISSSTTILVFIIILNVVIVFLLHISRYHQRVRLGSYKKLLLNPLLLLFFLILYPLLFFHGGSNLLFLLSFQYGNLYLLLLNLLLLIAHPLLLIPESLFLLPYDSPFRPFFLFVLIISHTALVSAFRRNQRGLGVCLLILWEVLEHIQHLTLDCFLFYFCQLHWLYFRS